MTLPMEARYDFVPTASIIAFIFIGIFVLIGIIGRCFALNQSTIGNTQSLDLIIYREPPKANPLQQRIRVSMDIRFNANDH